MTGEFEKGPWSNVPGPIGAHERQTAYVFLASTDPTQPFQLPSSTTAVTPASPGALGYGFSTEQWPGNLSLYAIAGIENDSLSPPTFTGYAMGAVVGVSVLANQITTPVYIQMNRALDQALTMTVAVTLGPAGNYALLPAGYKSLFLPVQGSLSFVGLPPLTASLAGSSYVVSASAVTGPSGTAPLSVIGAMTTTTTSQPLAATGFVGVPVLTTPATSTTWDGMHLATTFAQGNAAIDITVYNIVSGNGLAHWQVAVPGGSQAITLPSLQGLDGALPSGPINIAVYGGNIPGFDYGTLTYRQLSPQGMSAYSLDTFDANL
jgi:hypothetical protein